MKPSHVRKRNFGATFADAVDKANAERLSDLNNGLRGGEAEVKERPRSVVRTRGGDEWSVERLLQRASVIKPRLLLLFFYYFFTIFSYYLFVFLFIFF